MDFWGNLWSFLTGVGTLALAAATYKVILQGKQQERDLERQHRDQFKPICLLAPYSGIDAWQDRGRLVYPSLPANDPLMKSIGIRCIIQNIGAGPALNLHIRFRFVDMAGWSSEPWELSPLPAGAELRDLSGVLFVPFHLNESFNETDFKLLSDKSWEILLEYEDIFGKRFTSTHSKLRFANSSMPDKSLVPIPWFSFSEH